MSLCANYEDDMIPSEKWRELFNEMPKKCQEFVEEMERAPDCMGLGKNEEYGWFICGSGQGTGVYWSEKEASILADNEAQQKEDINNYQSPEYH